ncbi:MAG: polyribonucleotide nucleotidyltransferase [Spirochaetales bacterium]|nr:polyribonucleotide nucleotidyltransferase [Spirochaetales bacterium]MCF7938847.1 polyribonucleotide nucleotidyltransferase [Spirochaetales bacterium]
METVSMTIGDNELVLETGKMAKQANGAVLARLGGTTVLSTACADQIVEGLDFVALMVEYNEKFYAAGKIPGGFIKREGRPKDKEILVSRLIDRPIRPLLSKKFNKDIQIVPTVLSTDQTNPPDVVAMVAASAALVISDIPFEGPIGAVRVASVDNELVLNPTFEQIKEASLDIIVAGTAEGITMVEGGGDEVPEDTMIAAIDKAKLYIEELCRIQSELRIRSGKDKLPLQEIDETLEQESEIRSFAEDQLKEALFLPSKIERSKAVSKIKDEALENFTEKVPEEKVYLIKKVLGDLEKEIVRSTIAENNKRNDGRDSKTIRPISCEIDVLERTHGSGLFTRGETQALAITTLGTVYDEQIFDDIEGDRRENFMLHYNFPPYSVGETGRLGTGRREVGHGHLALRALQPMLPEKEDFPYTIRVVSEILESNGSSSMATVCGGTLSLLNAGVPMKKPVAGIAMGLIKENDKTVILSDILGEEDHLGDMDFKVAGTNEGITAFQMDIKITGVDSEIMKQALEQARDGRLHILELMNQTIGSPREEISRYAPKIINFKIDTEKIGAVIGPGGKNIKQIAEETDSTVNIEDDGTVTIYCKSQEGANAAQKKIQGYIEEPEVGKIYQGTVKRIVDFGAFIEILPGKEGLCHISKLSRNRVNSVEDVLHLNQQVPVKLVEIDRMGRLNLSYIEAIDPDYVPPAQDHRNDSRNDSRGGSRRGGSNNRDRDQGGRDRGHGSSDRRH